MLGRVVWGSRTWMCTMAAQALAASMADCAICCGVTGTAGFFPGVSADPVTAHEIITLRCIVAPASNHIKINRHAVVHGANARSAGAPSQACVYDMCTWAAHARRRSNRRIESPRTATVALQ